MHEIQWPHNIRSHFNWNILFISTTLNPMSTVSCWHYTDVMFGFFPRFSGSQSLISTYSLDHKFFFYIDMRIPVHFLAPIISTWHYRPGSAERSLWTLEVRAPPGALDNILEPKTPPKMLPAQEETFFYGKSCALVFCLMLKCSIRYENTGNSFHGT